jgi:CBS domain-containing protein
MIAVVRIGDVMTGTVITAERSATIGAIAELMRDRNVGSVVICDDGRPHALITDRDVALAVADSAGRDTEADPYASRPLVTGEPDMDIEEGVALMVQHGIRRLPLVADGDLRGIVTLDDLAVRSGDPAMAQHMTAAVARAALPEFYFHQRGG